ncbi:hypothetical protein [Leptospira jelokensis]|uniref:hypothetical protein n=1 Tax=Leptospira jelokensis TaxID=2484931 RepID=UPI001090E5A4|nr:hypothetical protein [Leptospira jelokensis]TGM07160.1 hypothetical protein EHQ79_00025 [Leptospira jelokensis]
MNTFTQTFKTVEEKINPQITKLGFKLADIHTSETQSTMAVFASANYIEISKYFFPKCQKRFISLNIAPLRLDLSLDFGWGKKSYTIYELYELEGNFKFPERRYNLYEAMYDEYQLQAEFERLLEVFIGCSNRFLSNDKTLEHDLEEQRSRKSIISENEIIFKKAEKAFKNQLWGEVVSLLSDKKKYLNNLNQKRLQFAKKKIQKKK